MSNSSVEGRHIRQSNPNSLLPVINPRTTNRKQRLTRLVDDSVESQPVAASRLGNPPDFQAVDVDSLTDWLSPFRGSLRASPHPVIIEVHHSLLAGAKSFPHCPQTVDVMTSWHNIFPIRFDDEYCMKTHPHRDLASIPTCISRLHTFVQVSCSPKASPGFVVCRRQPGSLARILSDNMSRHEREPISRAPPKNIAFIAYSHFGKFLRIQLFHSLIPVNYDKSSWLDRALWGSERNHRIERASKRKRICGKKPL